MLGDEQINTKCTNQVPHTGQQWSMDTGSVDINNHIIVVPLQELPGECVKMCGVSGLILSDGGSALQLVGRSVCVEKF